MLIKLNYSAGNAKWQYQIWRVINECINNTGITSIATLQSTATSGSWDSSLLSGLDTANSYIVRTSGLSTSNTKSHIFGAPVSSNSFGGVKFTIEQSVYDSLSTKYYIQIQTGAYSTATQTTPWYGLSTSVGTSVSGGTISSSGLAITVANGTTTASGTNLTVGGYSTTGLNTNSYTQSGPGNSIFTAWVYISDTCFMYALNNLGASATGFPGTLPAGIVTSSTYVGPHIFSQYNRYDDWNTQSNNIYPVVFPGSANGSFGNTGMNVTQFSEIKNQYNSGNYFYLLNGPTQSAANSMNMSSNTAPILISAKVPAGLMVAGRPCAYVSQLGGSQVTTVNTASYGQNYTSTVGSKFPNSTLTASSFIQYPLQWENHYYGMMGGGISERGGFYLFNGDFSGGDEYTIGSTTYVIWIFVDQGTSDRIGIAVPKL